jgi:hypothetical protein
MFWDRRAMIEWSFALRFEPSKLVVVTVWRMLPTLLDFSHTLPEELLLLFRDSTADDTGSLEGVTPRPGRVAAAMCQQSGKPAWRSEAAL